MLSWEKYLANMVDSFREHYDKLTAEEKSEAQLNLTFAKPCQIEVFSFRSPRVDMLLISLNPTRPDKEFNITENITNTKAFILKRAEDDAIFTKHRAKFIEITKRERKNLGFRSWSSLEKNLSVYIFGNFRRAYAEPKSYAEARFNMVKREIEKRMSSKERFSKYDDINTEINGLKKQLEKISNPQIRNNTLASTQEISTILDEVKKIEEYGERIDKIEQDIGGMRKLVGTETYGEWKVLLSEIDKVNTRIDSLSDIRDAYDKVLAQQSAVMKQQSSFVTWIKYATILVPIAVISVPIIEILLRHFLSIT